MRALALTLLLPLAGCAATTSEPETPAAPQGLTPQQIVAARQSAFHLTAGTSGAMKAVIDSGGEVKPLAFGARGLARWARTMPQMFPVGTNLADSRAKPEIWQNKADFDAKAAAMAAEATRLAELAQAGEKAGFATQWAAVGRTCSACHDLYRAEPAR